MATLTSERKQKMKDVNAEILMRIFKLYDTIERLSADNETLARRLNQANEKITELESDYYRPKEAFDRVCDGEK